MVCTRIWYVQDYKALLTQFSVVGRLEELVDEWIDHLWWRARLRKLRTEGHTQEEIKTSLEKGSPCVIL